LFGKNLLAFLNRLSKVCPLEKAITLLTAQVAHQLSFVAGQHPKYYPKPHIIPADVLQVWEQIKPLTSCLNNQLLLEQSWAAEAAQSRDDQINAPANDEGLSYTQEIKSHGGRSAVKLFGSVSCNCFIHISENTTTTSCN